MAECAADTSEGQDYYEDFGPLPHVDDVMMVDATWKVDQLLCCKLRAKKKFLCNIPRQASAAKKRARAASDEAEGLGFRV